METKIFFASLVAFVLCFSVCSSSKNITQEKENQEKKYQEKGNAQLTETYWKLVEIFGQKIEPTQNPKEAHIILKIENNRVVGNSGCNNFTGEYEILANKRIRFSKVASTKMMCLNMEIENNMFKIFDEVANYEISGDVLVLSKSERVVIAKFEAVYLR